MTLRGGGGSADRSALSPPTMTGVFGGESGVFRIEW